MSKERLEQIKDAIAHELGLTDDYMDGTYLYHLTRSKSAFAVGTMTLDDFKEIDEELLDEIFNAIEPFFIEQAERVQELEIYVDENSKKHANLNVFLQDRDTTSTLGMHVIDAVMKYAQELEVFMNKADESLVKSGKQIMKLTDEKAELEYQNKRYREALEFYANKNKYMYKSTSLKGHPTIISDEGEIARKALEDGNSD